MSDLNIGKVIIDQTKTSQVTVNYADTSKPDTSTITSNRTQMTATVDSISTVFEVSKTYYFDADGGLVTTNQGYGTLGTTDSDGVLTVAHSTPSLTLDSPLESAKFKLNETITVKWTANNITLINIVIESATGIKTVKNIDATLGTYDVDLTADAGDFRVNQEITIAIENVVGSIADSADISSIATVTINTPTLTAGTEGNVTGTSNGVEVDIYFRTSADEEEEIEAGEWEIFEEGVEVDEDGNWSATGTIADADTYDFIAEDTTDRDGSAQVEDVVVASGEIMIDDFESYSNGQDLINASPWNSVSFPLFSATTAYAFSGTKSVEVGCSDWSVLEAVRTISSIDCTGKKISFRIRRASNNSVGNVRVSLYSGESIAGDSGTYLQPSISTSSFTELVVDIDSNIDVNKMKTVTKIGIAFQGSIYYGRAYIDDLKII